jgi:hypothetical protein
VQQILVVLIIILKRGMRPIKRALIITARAVLVIIMRITTIKRILMALEYKKGSKDRCYRLH